jgi:PKD repeat protein
MLGRTLAIVAFSGILIACAILLSTDAMAGDEDFYGVEGRPVAFNVTVDPGGPVDRWWWDFQGDGCFTWSSLVGPNATHTYAIPGLYYPILKATNGTVMVKTWIFQALIEPNNAPPQVVVNPEYKAVIRGDTVTFTGTAIDDGEVVLYEWDFDGDGIFDYESTVSATATWVYSGLGEHTAVLRATDDQGATGTATVTVVTHNQPPTVWASDIVSDTEEVTLQVNADDPDGEIVSYIWDPGDGSGNITTELGNVAHTYPSTGQYRVHVTVVDNDGANSTTNFKVVREPPRVLHQVFASASEDEVYIGASIIFQVEVVGEDDPSTYVLEWDLGDGNVSTEWSIEHTYDSPGTYTVSIVVVDSELVEVTDELVVKVLWIPNQLPVAVPSVEQWVLPGRNLRFSDESYDVDGTIVLWQWDFDGDGDFDHSNTTDGNHTHVYADEGIYTAVLRVTDNRGDVGIATVVIKVDTEAPGDDPVDDSKGAAVCCGATVVIMVLVAYWTVRRTMVTPRKDGGPAGPPADDTPVEPADEDVDQDGNGEQPSPADD